MHLHVYGMCVCVCVCVCVCDEEGLQTARHTVLQLTSAMAVSGQPLTRANTLLRECSIQGSNKARASPDLQGSGLFRIGYITT